MLTVEKLKSLGANTEEGLQRCMNNEAFYLRLVNRFLEDNSFNRFKSEIENNNLEEAFKHAHALKGVLGNLSLTPLYEIIFEMTELLRNQTKCDYSEYINKYTEIYNQMIS